MARDTTGAVTFEALSRSEVTQREKAAAADYAEACKAYREVRKDNPSEPKPRQATLVVIEKSVKGKDKAEALAARYREKYEQAQARKQEKEPAEGTAKPTEDKDKPLNEAGADGKADKKSG